MKDKKKKNRVKKIVLCLILTVLLAGCGQIQKESAEGTVQTQVENAQFIIDKAGVPIMDIKDIGEVRHPAWIGIYALQYGGAESFYEPIVDENQDSFTNCISWLKENCKTTAEGYTVWLYNFDSTYNDVTIKAPWYSAFGQALPIEALVEYYNQYGDQEALKLAEDAAEVLFADIKQGGLLFQDGEDCWFEEIPTKENPSHILNGHMRALIALEKLYQSSDNMKYQDWFEKGTATLNRWLPRYDTGYWLRYDLNPRKEDLLFRFYNQYGYQLPDIAIDSIAIKDSITGEQITIDVGDTNDAVEGMPRIAGNDWQATEELDGRSVRRIKPVLPEHITDQSEGGLFSPYTYFYLNLPSQWKNNLRSEWFELTIVYKDEQRGNMNVQMRSIAPGESFVDLKDGELLLTGSGKWREWKIPLRVSDLGWWTGELYAEKHKKYLDWLSEYSGELKPWKEIAEGYLNNKIMPEHYDFVYQDHEKLPQQRPPIPVYSLDENGVLMQHIGNDETVFDNGSWKPGTGIGKAVYSPYVIASQAIYGKDAIGTVYDLHKYVTIEDDLWTDVDWLFPDNLDRIRPENGFHWLEQNSIPLKDSLLWVFDYENCYNDLVQKPGWASAFSQRYVIDAFIKSAYSDLATQAAYAYDYGTDIGGLSSFAKDGNIWFEEVPNNSHILNAHLASLVALGNLGDSLRNDRIKKLYNNGMISLQENLYRYDTGYWTKYDMNPKKELLLQIDWQGSGTESPYIDEIQLYNPVTNTASRIDIGADDSRENTSHITGAEWLESEIIDEKTVRRFLNGYNIHPEAAPGGTRHNVYINMILPKKEFHDYFDVPNHKLLIRYKDVSVGEFAVKIQAINEGNALSFTEIPNAVIRCTGDNKWKTAIIDLRPQDIGWYMGSDYLSYHNEQLGILAEESGFWLLKQYTEKWKDYLKCYQDGFSPIISKIKSYQDISAMLKVINHSPTYDGFGLDNSLDGDTTDDYTAFLESDEPQFFTMGFDQTYPLSRLVFIFESDENIATDYAITFYREGKECGTIDINGQNTQQQIIDFEMVEADSFQVTVKRYKGQSRILLRMVKAYSSQT